MDVKKDERKPQRSRKHRTINSLCAYLGGVTDKDYVEKSIVTIED